MKVYVLLNRYYGELLSATATSAEVLGVYADKEKAKEAMLNQVIADSEDDWVQDEQYKKDSDAVVMFYGYQENWNNYYETEIIECEVE